MRKLYLSALLALFGIAAVTAAIATFYYDWFMSMDSATPEVQFYSWSDGALSSSVDLSYNIYADAWVVDSNATWGIKNGGAAPKAVYLWVESVTDSSKFGNYTVIILDPNENEMCRWTTTNFANVGESNAASWTASPNIVYTISVMYLGSSTASSGASTINLRLKILP